MIQSVRIIYCCASLLSLLTSCTSVKNYTSKAILERKSEYDADKLFIGRWSPRAMSGEAISHHELMTLFEAARWAPSASNNQPWRFIYAHNNTPEWDLLFNCLVEFNQLWCKNAAVLIAIISKNTRADGRRSRTHSFDTGAAWENLSLQGSIMNLVVHGMGGFDYDRLRKDLMIPHDYTVEAMCAIGKPGPIDVLPERMQKREVPSQRKPISELVFHGVFKRNQS